MNYHLRSLSWLQLSCLAILALMVAPVAFAVVSSAPLAPHTGTAFLTTASLGGMIMLRDEAGEHATGGGGPVAVDDAIRAISDTSMTMSQRLSVAMQALKGVDPTNQLATIKADLDKARADLAARDTEVTDLKAAVEKLNTKLAARDEDVKQADEARAAAEKRTQELEAKEQDLEKRALAKSKEKLGAIGIASTDLPAPDAKVGTTEVSAEDQIRALSGSRRTEAALHFKQHGKLPDWFAAEYATVLKLQSKKALALN